jgi:hypothetical protein
MAISTDQLFLGLEAQKAYPTVVSPFGLSSSLGCNSRYLSYFSINSVKYVAFLAERMNLCFNRSFAVGRYTSAKCEQGREQAYSSRISLDTLSHEILERSGELGIVKLRGWVFGNDEQDLPSALLLESSVFMSWTYFHRMQISIGWFTHSKLDSRDTCKSAGTQKDER